MGVFDGNTIQTTDGEAVAETVHDNSLPQIGSLHLGARILTPTALPQTNGVDCRLVVGDLWTEIQTDLGAPGSGNVTTNIANNENRTIGSTAAAGAGGGNQTLSIFGVENVTVQATGSVMETYQGPVIRSFSQDVSESYSGKHNVDGGDDWYSAKPTDINFVGLSHSVTFMQLELTGAHAECASFHFEAKPVHGQYFGIDQQNTSINFKGEASDNDVKLLEGRVGALETKLAGARTHVAPTLNGAPSSLPGLH